MNHCQLPVLLSKVGLLESNNQVQISDSQSAGHGPMVGHSINTSEPRLVILILTDQKNTNETERKYVVIQLGHRILCICHRILLKNRPHTSKGSEILTYKVLNSMTQPLPCRFKLGIDILTTQRV